VRIASIEATPLAIPLTQEFHWAGGAQHGANLVLFAVHTEDGVVGYGESVCEAPLAVVEIGRLMARQLVGRSVGDVETRGGRYVLSDASGHGFELDEGAVARAHERWQRDGAFNTIESVSVE
jgi:L-alanine-DL-glutamate epimerase-like enolase superfamily enzyme